MSLRSYQASAAGVAVLALFVMAVPANAQCNTYSGTYVTTQNYTYPPPAPARAYVNTYAQPSTVYVERPVYVQQPVVVERPVYVQQPVYVPRPVYVAPRRSRSVSFGISFGSSNRHHHRSSGWRRSNSHRHSSHGFHRSSGRHHSSRAFNRSSGRHHSSRAFNRSSGRRHHSRSYGHSRSRPRFSRSRY